MTSLSHQAQNATPPDFFVAFCEKVRRETERTRTPEERRKVKVMMDGFKRTSERIAREARHSLQIAKEKMMRRFLWRAQGTRRARRAQRTPQSHRTDSGPGGDPDPEPRPPYSSLPAFRDGGAA